MQPPPSLLPHSAAQTTTGICVLLGLLPTWQEQEKRLVWCWVVWSAPRGQALSSPSPQAPSHLLIPTSSATALFPCEHTVMHYLRLLHLLTSSVLPEHIQSLVILSLQPYRDVQAQLTLTPLTALKFYLWCNSTQGSHKTRAPHAPLSSLDFSEWSQNWM